jgi:hypothetical protein
MRTKIVSIVIFGLVLATSDSLRAEDNAEARAIVDKAIEAHGGVAELKKLQNCTQKIKGTIQAMGQEILFTGDLYVSGETRVRVQLEIEVMNMKIAIVNVVNKDKGWAKVGENTVEMKKEQIEEGKETGNVGAITSLAPLKNKEYTVSLVGEDKVGTIPVQVIRVSRKNYRDVNLSFDKKTNLLLKTESRAKDENGTEMNEERFYSDYNEKGLRQPKKMVVKRDGKTYLEADILELKVDEKFDDSSFDKP